MALVDIPEMVWPPHFGLNTSTSGLTLSATNTKIAFIFRATKTGNIAKVGFRVSAVTTSQSLTVSIQNISSGTPDGIAVASGTQGSEAANTWYEVTLGSVVAVTKGTYYCAVIEWTSTQGSISLSAGSAIEYYSTAPSILISGTWTPQARTNMVALVYDDGLCYSNLGILAALPSATSYNSGSAADEIANMFVAPCAMRVTGLLLIGGPAGTSANLDGVLYDSASTAQGRGTLLANVVQATGNVRHPIPFATNVTLTAGSRYRAAIQPTTANNIAVATLTAPSTAYMSQQPGGSLMQGSTRVDLATTGGTLSDGWTNTSTVLYGIALIIDQIDSGSSGILINPGMGGGLL